MIGMKAVIAQFIYNIKGYEQKACDTCYETSHIKQYISALLSDIAECAYQKIEYHVRLGLFEINCQEKDGYVANLLHLCRQTEEINYSIKDLYP